ncbi:hypothetical protein [uncultured Roseobacter sp.]|uniref:hypothetical protein n=1 Tax=uncultured Roseobacter sp. TaxID=114847 RepID=UPI00260B18C7|nr:hypothetical protein [uncultured Roseobacter sp.]
MTDYVGKLDTGKVEDVEKIIQFHWNSLIEDPATQAVARERGVDIDVLSELGAQAPFVVELKKSGNRSDVVTAILIGVAVGVGKDIVKTAIYAAWDKVIKPNLPGMKDPPPDASEPEEPTSKTD